MKKLVSRLGCMVTAIGGTAVLYLLLNKDLTKNTGGYTFVAILVFFLGLLIWRKAKTAISEGDHRGKRRSWVTNDKNEE